MARFQELLETFFYRPDEPVGAWLEVSVDQTQAPVAAPDEEPHEFLAFELEHETYAVDIDTVREILKVPPLTPVPRGSRSLLGVMNLRGEVLPVYDVRVSLGLRDAKLQVDGAASVPKPSRVVLVRDEEGDAGILVDRVLEVVKLLPSKLEAPPPGTGSSAAIAGLGRRGESLYILLDVRQVLE